MRRVMVFVAACALLSPAAAEAAAPVEVVSSSVRLERADRADVRVRCERARECRGFVTFDVPCDQRDAPAIDRRCRTFVGSGEFRIPGRRTRTVRVLRLGIGFTSSSGDSSAVRAVAFLDDRRRDRASRPRALTLVAPIGLLRPAVWLTLRDVEALATGDDPNVYDLAFEVHVPRGSFSAKAAVGRRSTPLHPAGAQPFVVPPRSFAPGGVSFHGSLRTNTGELPPRSRQRIGLTACALRGCETETTILELPGPDDPRPICHIGLGEVSARTRLLAGLPR